MTRTEVTYGWQKQNAINKKYLTKSEKAKFKKKEKINKQEMLTKSVDPVQIFHFFEKTSKTIFREYTQYNKIDQSHLILFL